MLSGFVHNVSVNTLSLFLSCQLLTWVFGHHVETDVRQKFQPYHPRPTPDQAAITGVNKAGVNKAEGKILKNLWGRNEKDTSTSLCSLTSCEFVWLRFNKMSLESFFIFTRSFFITKKKYAPHVNHYYSHVRWNYQVRRRWTGEKIRKTFGENTRNDQYCYQHHLEQILGISFQKLLVVTAGLIFLKQFARSHLKDISKWHLFHIILLSTNY